MFTVHHPVFWIRRQTEASIQPLHWFIKLNPFLSNLKMNIIHIVLYQHSFSTGSVTPCYNYHTSTCYIYYTGLLVVINNATFHRDHDNPLSEDLSDRPGSEKDSGGWRMGVWRAVEVWAKKRDLGIRVGWVPVKIHMAYPFVRQKIKTQEWFCQSYCATVDLNFFCSPLIL